MLFSDSTFHHDGWSEHVTAFEKGASPLGDAFCQFLKVWLGAHIQGIDRKYREHSKGMKKTAQSVTTSDAHTTFSDLRMLKNRAHPHASFTGKTTVLE